MYVLSFIYRPTNFLGKKITLIPKKAILFILIGSITSLLSDIYRLNWIGLGVHILVSILYLYIYNTQRLTYRTVLENENR